MRGMRGALGAVMAVAIVAAASGSASAQDIAPALRAHRLTVSGGVQWAGGYPIGDSTATIRRNSAGSTPPPFTLFEAESSFGSVTGVEARVGITLTGALTLELGGAYSQPRISLAISGDPEAAAQTIAGERISQYVIDLGVVWQLPRIRIGPRGRPYLTAGGGYLRQLYPDRTRGESGQLYHLGGGLRYWLRGGDGTGRDLGLRADVRAYLRHAGIELEGQSRIYPAATLSLFAAF